MNIKEVINSGKVDFTGVESSYFLLGLLSAFENRFQAVADKAMKEISWKQFFAIICINLCRESPTIKELSDFMGSSHQNVKQILNKLENKGYIEMLPDESDKRKQRIIVTEKTKVFCAKHDENGQQFIRKLFEGIPDEDIQTVIRTIMQMEKNLEEIL